MTTSTTTGLDIQLNELFQDAVKLSQSDKVWDLYRKAEAIPGLGFILKNKELQISVLSRDAMTVMKWLNHKVKTLNKFDLDTVKGIFFFVGLVSNHSDFWSSLRSDGDKLPKQLVDCSRFIIGNFSSVIHFDFSTSYHEEKRKEHLRKIVSDNDWSKIYDEYHRSHENFEHSICYSLKSAFTLLYYFDEKSLMSILDVKRDIPFMWGMMALMGKSKAMTIALDTSNQTLKFCAISSVLPFSGKDSLSESESEKLTKVFLNIMKDEKLWLHWMRILNTYPSRYPHIQLSLGKALAQTTSENAVQSYFKAIHLYMVDFHDIGRKSVSECLESFSQLANEEKQKLTWDFAFRIWDNWDFGVRDKDGHLFEIKASALDYAITRYYLDCCDSKQRKALIEELFGKLNNIDNIWHQTSSKRITYWYLHHAKFQPLHHAEEVSRNKNLPCLMQGVFYQNQYENYIQYMIN
ncbi:hypothetical protein V6260_17380 [Pseudoalteromonas aliena]|uniref:hypothetical protein n=1 Tax=Pseudoalteromonas aliena TaxID=247523 RepID=UPI00311F959A